MEAKLSEYIERPMQLTFACVPGRAYDLIYGGASVAAWNLITALIAWLAPEAPYYSAQGVRLGLKEEVEAAATTSSPRSRRPSQPRT